MAVTTPTLPSPTHSAGDLQAALAFTPDIAGAIAAGGAPELEMADRVLYQALAWASAVEQNGRTVFYETEAIAASVARVNLAYDAVQALANIGQGNAGLLLAIARSLRQLVLTWQANSKPLLAAIQVADSAQWHQVADAYAQGALVIADAALTALESSESQVQSWRTQTLDTLQSQQETVGQALPEALDAIGLSGGPGDAIRSAAQTIADAIAALASGLGRAGANLLWPFVPLALAVVGVLWVASHAGVTEGRVRIG